jgi:predicted RNA-binding Zn-ribbon protein involved in translation (DUF1610 family)
MADILEELVYGCIRPPPGGRDIVLFYHKIAIIRRNVLSTIFIGSPEEWEGHNLSLICPRCGKEKAILTDRHGLDQAMARYYQGEEKALTAAGMCADPRQLSVMVNNLIRRFGGRKTGNAYLVCPECAFWQYW